MRWRDLVHHHLAVEGIGLVLIAFVVFGALALLTHSPADPILELGPVRNGFGAAGATFAGLLQWAVGPGGFVLVAAAGVVGVRLVVGRGAPRIVSLFWVGALLLLVAVATLPVLFRDLAPARFAATPGNALGTWLAAGERAVASRWGAVLGNGLLLLIGALAVTGISTRSALAAVWAGAEAVGGGALRLARTGGRALGLCGQTLAEGWKRSVRLAETWRERRARRTRVAAIRGVEHEVPEAGPEGGAAQVAEVARPARRRRHDPAIVDHTATRRAQARPEQEAFRFMEGSRGGPYELPDLHIFQRPPEGQRGYDRESLIMNSRILEKKLQDFGVTGRVVTVHPGPVVTMYEYEPAAGIKVNRIVNLADDLALALRALSVRIIAPLPGKAVVGIEVPNSQRDVVYIRELLESESFRRARSKLTIALGKDIFGSPVSTDLAQMPHLLVAGATGTGKSVFLNSLLCSLLFRATPDEMKLLLIDPKILELSVYEGVPHLVSEVVTNPKRAAAALFGVVQKMEERYQMMAALGVRNIQQFNAHVEEELGAGRTTARFKARPGEQGGEFELQPLAYIVVVIDELADLMVVSARDVEEALQRLAQMARAAGIHLVLATQRPSVDVLTGVIKANFPARISFQVSSRTDSRTVLDQGGADHLLGQGDMLFLPPGTSKLQRVHGAFVSEKEVTELVRVLRGQGDPQYDETITRAERTRAEREVPGEDVDEMYDRAIAIVAETRNASISYIQRRLKVGYNRAARMIEQMEADRIIGPQEGTKPREVFVRSVDVE